MNTLYAHSSESMPELDDAAVALTVTSPPYWNSVDYDRHAEDDRQWYRTRRYQAGFDSYAAYLDLMERIFREVLRVTAPGGFCAIVIGTVLLKGRHFPVPFDLVSRLCANGWLFHQDIIWHKCTAGVKRAGVTIQKPFPGYYYPNIMTEYILVLRKPGSASKRRRRSAHARIPINGLFVNEIANNVWHIAPVPPRHLDHPCPFPEEIPYRLISLYSHPGDLILDPFCGSGQTLKVAKHLGRRYVGYDIIPKYVEYARTRLNEPLAVRAYQLVARFDKMALDEPLKPQARRSRRGRADQTPLLFAR